MNLATTKKSLTRAMSEKVKLCNFLTALSQVTYTDEEFDEEDLVGG